MKLSLILVASGAVLFVVGQMNPGTAELQPRADRAAANFVEHDLLPAVQGAVIGVDNEEVRIAIAERTLLALAGGPQPGSYNSFIMAPRHNNQLPIAAYTLWNDKSFSGRWSDSPEYGRACAVLTVTHHDVRLEQLQCPKSVPQDWPGDRTLSSQGWFEETR